MPPCDSCAADAFLRAAGFRLDTAEDGRRWATRKPLRLPHREPCPEHQPTTSTTSSERKTAA